MNNNTMWLHRNIYWWIKPYGLINYFVIPMYIGIYFFNYNNDATYFKGVNFFTGLLFLVVLSVMAFVGSRVELRTDKNGFKIKELSIPLQSLDFLAILTIMAYLIWFYPVFSNISLFTTIISGQGGSDGVKYVISTLPGITTLSQLGILYISIYVYNKITRKKMVIRYNLYFYSILLLTIFRVLAWSERLAFIEIILPILLYLVSFKSFKGKLWNKLLFFMPYLGLGIIFLFFSITEYFRSWTFYQNVYDNYWSFISERFFNYYYSALNTGTGILTIYDWPTYNFINVFSWLYQLPGVGNYFINEFQIQDVKYQYLQNYGNLEFTNSSGLFIIIQDLGIIGGFVFIAILGFFSGLMYKNFINLNGIGILLYPIFYLTLVEVLRILYISQSRAFPVWLFALFIFVFFIKRKKSIT